MVGLKNYGLRTSKSRRLYEKACKVLPAGVSYIIRHFEPYPFYTAEAKGSKLFDVDGNEYIDFWIGHCSLILGHSPPEIMEEVKQQIEKGTQYGTSHELEIALAEQVVGMVPSAEMVRFTNSGTEATMYSIRLARTYTGREKIAKFEGGWHGGYDAVHTAVKPPLDIPESGGLTSGTSKDTLALPYNDIEEVRRRVKNEEMAAIIVEPVIGAGGCIPAEREFLMGLREICSERGTLLIFDEVITGFRLSPGGAQQHYGILPDITILGKILGGGFPVGAIAGRQEPMQQMDALTYKRPRFSFHGGTFCANPITMTAGLATLRMLEDGRLLNELDKHGDYVRGQLSDIFEKCRVNVQVTGVSSLFHTHFTEEEVKDVHGAFRADRERLLDYHLHLITKGVFFLPGKNGALSTAHTDEDVNRLLTEAEAYARGV
ncbi:MAG: aspartate aminotransferase family protein [Candidatus Bathyarchaeota archaeon]|nr:MAG: aspartate aminotransferase family protein [Candidatus Bathyarchaeota archaeon]